MTQLTRWRRLAAVATVAGLAVSTGAAAAVVPAGAVTPTVRTVNATTADGSAILVQVPSNWNGTLALYSHGYRGPVGDRTDAQDASTSDTATALLAEGYALAGSSYASNGWAVADGVHADELLLSWFVHHIGPVHRLYVWGDSLGGLVTEMFAEKHPGAITAAAPMCGVLAGSNRNLDEALDAAVTLKALLLPKLKLRGFTSYADAAATYQSALTAIEDGVSSSDASTQARFVSRLLAMMAITDGPRKTQHYDGAGLGHAVGAAVEGAGYALYYGTVARWEIEQRVGGDPSTNVGVDYRDRISSGDLSWWEGFGFSGDLLRSYAKTVQFFGARRSADTDARRAFAKLGIPTGDIGKPTLTLHTRFDPLVLVQNERVFGARVASHGMSGDLLQLYVAPPRTYASSPGAPYGAGHCNFTTGDRVAVIHALDSWVSTGSKPTAAQLASWFPARAAGQGGLLTSWTPPAWPAR